MGASICQTTSSDVQIGATRFDVLPEINELILLTPSDWIPNVHNGDGGGCYQ